MRRETISGPCVSRNFVVPAIGTGSWNEMRERTFRPRRRPKAKSSTSGSRPPRNPWTTANVRETSLPPLCFPYLQIIAQHPRQPDEECKNFPLRNLNARRLFISGVTQTRGGVTQTPGWYHTDTGVVSHRHPNKSNNNKKKPKHQPHLMRMGRRILWNA